MIDHSGPIPVVLFAYARPDHLRRTLECLRTNAVPLLYVFSDGPKNSKVTEAVATVRAMLHAIDWCEVHLCEQAGNLGLGRSIREGVTAVLKHHAAALVFEDDLICVPGTYAYLCDALRFYEGDRRVMSVTGWTHPRVTPDYPRTTAYFDGRAECLVWGTWSWAWQAMDRDAQGLIRQCRARGLDIYRYGADLPAMASVERERNIWAVRWLYAHILYGGLCLRAPQSLVEHIGFDHLATNASDGEQWANAILPEQAPVERDWPMPVEHPACSGLWRREYGDRPSTARRILRRLARVTRTVRDQFR